MSCLGAHERWNITKMHATHAGASRHRFALQKCMPEHPDTVSHYKNACRGVRTPFRVTKMHAGASRRRFALQKCRPEGPKPFRTTKMHAAAHGAQKHEFYRAKRFRALRRFALQKCRSQLRARKDVCFTNGSQSPNHVFGLVFCDSVR